VQPTHIQQFELAERRFCLTSDSQSLVVLAWIIGTKADDFIGVEFNTTRCHHSAHAKAHGIIVPARWINVGEVIFPGLSPAHPPDVSLSQGLIDLDFICHFILVVKGQGL